MLTARHSLIIYFKVLHHCLLVSNPKPSIHRSTGIAAARGGFQGSLSLFCIHIAAVVAQNCIIFSNKMIDLRELRGGLFYPGY